MNKYKKITLPLILLSLCQKVYTPNLGDVELGDISLYATLKSKRLDQRTRQLRIAHKQISWYIIRG